MGAGCQIGTHEELYDVFYYGAWYILPMNPAFYPIQILFSRIILAQPMVTQIKQNKQTNHVEPIIKLIVISGRRHNLEVGGGWDLISYPLEVLLLWFFTCGTPSSNAASTKLSNNWRRDPAEMTWQFTRSETKRTKYRASSHLELFKQSFNDRIRSSTHWKSRMFRIYYS